MFKVSALAAKEVQHRQSAELKQGPSRLMEGM